MSTAELLVLDASTQGPCRLGHPVAAAAPSTQGDSLDRYLVPDADEGRL
jgi:hypothetical protein